MVTDSNSAHHVWGESKPEDHEDSIIQNMNQKASKHNYAQVMQRCSATQGQSTGGKGRIANTLTSSDRKGFSLLHTNSTHCSFMTSRHPSSTDLRVANFSAIFMLAAFLAWGVMRPRSSRRKAWLTSNRPSMCLMLAWPGAPTSRRNRPNGPHFSSSAFCRGKKSGNWRV